MVLYNQFFITFFAFVFCNLKKKQQEKQKNLSNQAIQSILQDKEN